MTVNVLTQRAVYLDHNATHPLLPAVRAGLSQALVVGDFELLNPSSVHRHGQAAKAMVSKLRTLLGQWAGRGDGDEWVFNSGATESINTVLRGFCSHRKSFDRNPYVITSTAEHSAVLETLDHCGAQQSFCVPVDNAGRLDFLNLKQTLENILEASAKNDVLVSLNLLNNETGVLLDFEALMQTLRELCQKYETLTTVNGAQKFTLQNEGRRVWLHLDAAQALGKLDPRILRLAWHGADYVSVSAHKMGAAAGIGALWLRPQVPFESFMTGGVQEKKRRAGTFNSIAALSWILALEDWGAHGDAYRKRLGELRLNLHQQLSEVPGYHAHGISKSGQLPAMVNTLNFHVDGCDEESLVMALDVEGFSVSSGSACNSGSLKPSHVLMAMGYGESIALSSVRASLGVTSTQQEVDDFVVCLKAIVKRIKDGKDYWASVLPQMKDQAAKDDSHARS